MCTGFVGNELYASQQRRHSLRFVFLLRGSCVFGRMYMLVVRCSCILYIYIYFLFLVYGARSTPRPQPCRVATLCTGAAFTLYNDTMFAGMATLTGRKIVSWWATALRWEIFFFLSLFINKNIYI